MIANFAGNFAKSRFCCTVSSVLIAIFIGVFRMSRSIARYNLLSLAPNVTAYKGFPLSFCLLLFRLCFTKRSMTNGCTGNLSR